MIRATTLAVLMFFPAIASADSMVRIIDGDTLCVRDTCYRLIGYDTPETGSRAKCKSERELGEKAKRRLEQLLEPRGYGFAPEYCNCPAGTEGTQSCNHGRRCARIFVGGIDVGAILISEGLARPYVCSGTRCPTRQGWCP